MSACHLERVSRNFFNCFFKGKIHNLNSIEKFSQFHVNKNHPIDVIDKHFQDCIGKNLTVNSFHNFGVFVELDTYGNSI